MDKRKIEEFSSIESNANKLLWYADKYDGIPYCGLMLYNGRKCWYRAYDVDVIEHTYSDADLLKAGYRQDQLEFIDESDREWEEEVFYYKVYKLSNRDLLNIEDAHEKFRNKWGTHTDYDYKPLTEKRDKGLDNLLDNFFIKYYKKISKLIRRKKKNISEDRSPYFMDRPAKIYEKDIIGYFKI